MKIVYCIPSTYNSGGMERVLCQKANYISDILGYDVTIITSSQKGRNPFYSISKQIKQIDLGIDYESIMSLPLHKRIIARIKAKKTHKILLRKTLLDIKPDITISMFTHEMSFLPYINDGSKKVLELHFSKNFRKLDAQSNNRSLAIRTINTLLDIKERRHIKQYDKFIVLSDKDAEDWGKQYKNIYTIPNPTCFKVSKVVQSKEKRILAVGRLCRQKGFDILIDIWAQISNESKKGWQLDIIGTGPDKDMLQNRINQYKLEDSVKLIANTKEIQKEYNSHSIFCFTSRYEGFGLSLAEAMSFGMAAISFDCPCGPSELIENNKSGYLINSEDVESFAEKLEFLMNNEAERITLGKQASKRIADNYSESVIMTKWEILFKELAKH